MTETTKETDNRIKSLFLKGFDAKEIASMLSLKFEDVEKELKDCDKLDINKNSNELYSELQKDLSKLVLTEMNKDKRDVSVVLNAIKLQAELQEKKLSLVSGHSSEVISKDYIYKRDDEIKTLKDQGMSEEDIAKKFNVGILSIKQALDRVNLKLPETLRSLSPSIISETIGLEREARIKILQETYDNKYPRSKVRDIVNKIKNGTR